MNNMESFAEWIQIELDERGWSRLEAARRGGISASMFDKVINGYARPGIEFCAGISRAFGIPPEEIFRKAGILPDLQYGPLEEFNLRELYDLMKNLAPRERHDVIEYARMRYRIQREEQEKSDVENKKARVIGGSREWKETKK